MISAAGSKAKFAKTSEREPNMLDWSKSDVANWLFDVCRAPEEVIEKVLTVVKNGRDLAQAEYATFEPLGLGYFFTNLIFNEACLRRDYPEIRVNSEPYAWPYNGILHPGNTALVVVDMQNDFLDKEGYIAQVNKSFDINKAREIIPPLQSVLHKMRDLNFHIIHTREGHHGSLMDLPANKHWRSRMGRNDPGIGDPAPYKGGMSRILTRDQPGWEIIPELAPLPEEIIIDKPGKGAFCATSLELHLQLAKIQNLVFTGVTTDVCVHTIIREANDRGFECLLLGDATCSIEVEVHDAALRSIQLSNGIFGCTTPTKTFVDALDQVSTSKAARKNKSRVQK
jgi:nicotinamidase-related amidase